MKWSQIFSSASLFFVIIPCASATPVSDDARVHSRETAAGHPQVNYAEKLKQLIGNVLDGPASGFTRELLSADLSTQCSLGLFKFVRGIKNLEPWAMRMFDASGKYPTGMLQGSTADLGAFDECVETVVHDEYGIENVRGQYCNLVLYAANRTDMQEFITEAMVMTHPRVPNFFGHYYETNTPILRLGICMLNECSEGDLQKLFRAVLPSSVRVTVTNCVTSVPPAVTKGQVIIIAFLGFLSLLTVLGTVVDVCIPRKNSESGVKRILLSVATSFSVVSNTRMMLHVATDKSSEAYSYRFLHGLRFLSIIWVVVGHCYGSTSDVWSRLANTLIYADRWDNVVITSGFISVDTFFFLGGVLLAAVACKQRKKYVIAFVLGVVRRFVRTMVPVFFVIMCLHLLPLVVSGPNAKAFFTMVFEDTTEEWLPLLLQVRNYSFNMAVIPIRLFGHLWYLSLDFQFFLVCLPIILLLKRCQNCYKKRHSLQLPRIEIWRAKWAVATFTLLSLLSCSISAWRVAGTKMTPFIVAVSDRLITVLETMRYYYFYPFYHAACYFTGCTAFFLVACYKEQKVSKAFQTAAWCIAIGSGLSCIFLKAPWYQTAEPTNEFGKLSLAFFDRILWSVCLLWITFACATGRGGFLCTFLSWSAFAPLSRLSFGVYVIHWPFLQLVLHTARERMFFSYFFVVSFFFSVLLWSYLLSYLLFVFCEAPAGRLAKLIIDPPDTTRTTTATGDMVPKVVEPAVEKPTVIAILDDAKKYPVQSANAKNSFNGVVCENLTSYRL